MSFCHPPTPNSVRDTQELTQLPTISWWHVFDGVTYERWFVESECQHDRRQILALSDSLAHTLGRHAHVQLKWVKGHALVKRVDEQTLGCGRRK